MDDPGGNAITSRIFVYDERSRDDPGGNDIT